jgi:hypothetical protein
MKQINTYIIEKLKINKDSQLENITWDSFCKKYDVKLFTSERYHCKNVGDNIINGLDILLISKTDVDNFIKTFKKEYSIIEDLNLSHIGESDFSAEVYYIDIKLKDKSLLTLTIWPRSQYEFRLEYIDAKNKEVINDILANILYKIINKDF